MIGKVSWFASYLPLLLGVCFALFALGIVLRRDSTRYLKDSELSKIVTELTATWRTKIRGYTRVVAIYAVCLFAVIGFAIVPLQHIVMPARTITAHWWYFPHVPELMPDNQYVVLHLDKLDPLYGTRSRYTFCSSSVAMDMNEGEMVKDVVFKDHGDCIQLLNYNYERESYPPYRAKKYSKEAFQ